MKDIDEKIREIRSLMNGIDYNIKYELDDFRDLEEGLKESALEFLEELADELDEIAKMLIYAVDSLKKSNETTDLHKISFTQTIGWFQ